MFVGTSNVMYCLINILKIMKRYVEQLLEDIKSSEALAAKRVERIVGFIDLESDYVSDDDIDSLGIKLSRLFHLDEMFFPERRFLNEEQISLLVNSLERLWKAYRLNPLFPPNATNEVKYCQFRNHLNHEVLPVSDNTMDVELCDYVPYYCPLFEWCPLVQDRNECSSKAVVSR